jgi:hypothetical protein
VARQLTEKPRRSAGRAYAPSKTRPGGVRTFLLSYYINGSERRYRIGRWPEWSATAARAEAKKIRQQIDRGEDPAAERYQRRKPPTLWDLVDHPNYTTALPPPRVVFLPKGESVVYFVLIGNAIKIGFTNNVQNYDWKLVRPHRPIGQHPGSLTRMRWDIEPLSQYAVCK